MNAITLLKQDHGNVEELFHRFETAGADDHDERARIRDKFVEQLSVHAAIEEQLLYPALRSKVDAGDEAIVLEALEEHHLAKLALNEIEKLSPTHEPFVAKVTVLIENIRHHVKEEEEEMFPKLRDLFTVEELNELAEQMETAKATAPTRPHPLTPDVPPLNVLIGMPVAIIDRAMQTGKDVVGEVVGRLVGSNGRKS